LAEESFIRDLNIFSELKLRGSWGVVGNQAILLTRLFSAMNSGPIIRMPGMIIPTSLYYSESAEPDLKWESTTQKNIGLDVSIFRED
jgi:hypothetical protein